MTDDRVILDNVNDYVAPSQACINPLFAPKASVEEAAATNPGSPSEINNNGGRVHVRGRRRRRSPVVGLSTTTTTPVPTVTTPKDVVQASLADCLACSGCVTTAETVLLEQQHSLRRLRDKLHHSNERWVATVSAHASADLVRHINDAAPSCNKPWNHKTLLPRLATVLHDTLGISCLLDGVVPQGWSWQVAADEFVTAYRQAVSSSMLAKSQPPMDDDERYEKLLYPSRALSSGTRQVQLPHHGQSSGTTTITIPNGGSVRAQQELPVIASACPGVVCLVEKSQHALVPHLSRARSPLALAGRWWKSWHASSTHLAIMPCHDKKLEASRSDLDTDVDLVITISELWTLLQERLGDAAAATGEDAGKTVVLSALERAAPAQIWSSHDLESNAVVWPAVPALIATNKTQAPALAPLPHDMSAQGSGGYADYIFRVACQELFDVHLDAVPWTPVTNDHRVISARVAAARQKNHYQVALFRRDDGTYTCDQSLSPGDATCVLRFGIAYGMQTLQRVFSSAMSTSSLHYLEAMACPSGCVNGGGQLLPRQQEQRPSQVHERILATTRALRIPISGTPMPPIVPRAGQYTSYHVVPPLELAQGAAAGMAVQDIQW